jgi:predicted nucleotide-binding protein (sugar kinase/HSP70/actin superfamily)
MSYHAARLMAATFRAIGVDADVAPDSNDETLELGGLHSGGEECLPHKITLGDFLRITKQPGFDPRKTAFFMPRAPGPCRFGQYSTYLRQVLHENGLDDVIIFAPDSGNNYDELGDHASNLMRFTWMGIVVGDLAMRFLLKTRPYETTAGDGDAAYEASLADLCRVQETMGHGPNEKLAALREAVVRMRDRFRGVPARYEKGRPLIGLVGEIYCRLNTFSNEDTARRVEQLGGEGWLSDLSEWVWYTNWSRDHDWRRDHGRLNLEYLKLKLKTLVQRKYESKLLDPVVEDFVGYEEPHDIYEIIDRSEPYLPATGALGEMTLSVGKAIYLHAKGADGIIDISPFTCMNGIVSEAVYPAISTDYDDIPIRSVYFDKISTHIDRDLEIFLDLARAYQKRKKMTRVYPACFKG